LIAPASGAILLRKVISSNPTDPRHDWNSARALLDFSPKWRRVTRVFVLPQEAQKVGDHGGSQAA
jgi:hypothetical protein